MSDTIGTLEVLRLLGDRITYRQLDYWIRTGRVQVADSGEGSGTRRRFTPREVEALKRYVNLELNHDRAEEDLRSGRAWARILAEVAAVIVLVALGLSFDSLRADAESHQTTRIGLSKPVLGVGATGSDVRTLQAKLASLGYTIAVDGNFGPQTRRVVQAWQRANGLEPDGIVGPLTSATLDLASPPKADRDSTRGRSSPLPPAIEPVPGSVEEIIRSVWPDELEARALAIARRESRLVPSARNACCFGLFQIHWVAHRSWLGSIGITDPSQLLDPSTNARAALALFERDGWEPWSL